MRILGALALLLAPLPALAGQRATYTESDGKQLVVLVADNGDARITGPEPGQYGLYRGGEFYLVSRSDGEWSVARVADVAEAFATVMPTVFRDLAGAAGKHARPAPRIVAKGRGGHLGHDGERYEIFFAGSDKPTILLMSRDPRLRPIGAALEQFTLSLTMLMGAFIGPAVEEAMAETRAVFALGTPLDMEGSYKLVTLEEADVAHEAMEFPAPPQTLEQIVAQTKLRALPPEDMASPASGDAVAADAGKQPGGGISIDPDSGSGADIATEPDMADPAGADEGLPPEDAPQHA